MPLSIYPVHALSRCIFLAALVFEATNFGATNIAMADNWPNWRGPDNNGISKEKGLPTEWSETKNLAWKFALPGPGGATPVIWGERIFLTSADGSDQILFCISTGGKELWQRKVGSGGRQNIKGGEANETSASPSTDGKHVFAFVGSGNIACFDFEGKEIWKFNVQERYGKFQIEHGLHTTPLLHEDRLYLSLLHNGGHWVVALDKADGAQVWKVERKSDAKGESREAYSSPLLWREGDATHLIILGADYTTAHELKQGKEVWRLGDLNPKAKYSSALRIIASPVASPGLLVVPTARGGLMVGVKPGAHGTIASGSEFEEWRKPKGAPDVPSPLIHDGLVYLCGENGVLRCWDAKSGKQHYEVRVHDSLYRSSPVLANGILYLAARDGTFSLVQPGPKYTLLATNNLNDTFTASPSIADSRIYLRGYRALYAIGKEKQ